MIDPKIREAAVRLCYETTLQAQLVTVANGTLLYVFLRSTIDPDLLSGWLAALTLICALRIIIYAKFRRCPDLYATLRECEILSLTGATLAGLLWGSAGIILFAPESISHQAFLSFVLAGMTAGAVTTLSAQLPAAIIFIFLALVPWRSDSPPFRMNSALRCASWSSSSWP